VIRPPAIELHQVGKRYREYDETPSMVASQRRPGQKKHFWAMRDVDLTVEQGERVAVLGRNGAGKTTMLSLVAGVTSPSTGHVVVRGRIAPLLAVGVGFSAELTGRENVFVNAAVLGLPANDIGRRFDEIVDFSGLEAFIDTPVNTYSSGMFIRLGFAVAVHAEPDVLLVDEVLSVGDATFQNKCNERMQQLAAAGTTVLAVSHNLAGLRALCTRGVVVDAGRVIADLTFEEASLRYVDLIGGFGTNEGERAGTLQLALPADAAPTAGGDLDVDLRWSDIASEADELVDIWVGVTGPDGEMVYSELLRGAVRLSSHAARVRLQLLLSPGRCTVYAALRRPGRTAPLARAEGLPVEVGGLVPAGSGGVGMLNVELLDVEVA
jgi:ABC-type polysaccharide/polyol phosphate transport system ATPase subunit